MGKNFKVSIVVGLKDAASGGLRKALRVSRQGFQGLGHSVRSAGSHLLSFGAKAIRSTIRWLRQLVTVLAVAGTAIAEEFTRRSINAFADYEQSVMNAMTVTGAFGKVLEAGKKTLFDYGLALAVESNKMATEIAGAFYSLNSAGLSLNETMAAAPAVLALAEGTLADIGVVAELTTSSMKAFNLEASDTNRIANVLAASVGSSRMNVERLGNALPHAATTANEFNLSLEETVAALSMGVDRGLEASMAGTQFRMMLAKSTDVGNKGALALSKYGLSVADVNMKQRGMLPVLKTLKNAHVSYSDIVKVFGIRAATLVTILKDNTDEYVDMTQKITGTNRAFEMQASQLNTVAGQWKAFKGDVQKLQIEFAKELAPTLRNVIDLLRKFVQGLSARGVGEDLGKGIAAAFNSALDWVNAKFSETFSNLQKTVEEFIASWQEGGDQFKATGALMATALGDAIRTVVSEGLVAADTFFEKAFGSERWAAIKASVVETFGLWKEAIFEVLEALKAIMPHVVVFVKWLAGITAHNPKIALVTLGFLLLSTQILSVVTLLGRIPALIAAVRVGELASLFGAGAAGAGAAGAGAAGAARIGAAGAAGAATAPLDSLALATGIPASAAPASMGVVGGAARAFGGGALGAAGLVGGAVAAGVAIPYYGTGVGGALGEQASAARGTPGYEEGGWASQRWEGIKGAFGGQTRAGSAIEEFAGAPVAGLRKRVDTQKLRTQMAAQARGREELSAFTASYPQIARPRAYFQPERSGAAGPGVQATEGTSQLRGSIALGADGNVSIENIQIFVGGEMLTDKVERITIGTMDKVNRGVARLGTP